MDTRTGELIDLMKVKELPLKEQKWYKEVPKSFIPEFQLMNRKERREYYRKHKKNFLAIPKKSEEEKSAESEV